MKTLGLAAASVVAAALLALVVAGRMMTAFLSAPHAAAGVEPTIVEVSPELGTRALAERLATAGVVGKPDWLAVYLEHLHRGPAIVPGEYALSPSLSPAEIVDRLGRGAVVTYAITVSPGDTAAKVFQALAGQRLAPRGVLEASFRDPKLIERLNVPSTTLEGYLFADTYSFARGQTAEAILERMVHNYQQSLPKKLLEDARARGLAEAELVIVASLVERSGLRESEWPEYAALIHNRLRDQLPLEHDAALAYGLDKEKVEPPDLTHETPYNTFVRPGLPPTPIATPGLAALAAAAGPKGDGRYIAPRPDAKEGHVFCPDEDCQRAAYERAGVPLPPPRVVKSNPGRR